ncbi:hypothetical protein [Martelella sp. HB161492]|uniref:hypothetical protein n=1 Tax=Martelella sp. HB161492 TaxID=2720726 RepID=UPI00159021A1|nr:hypothetical protein [Martelella sp. HB161492]
MNNSQAITLRLRFHGQLIKMTPKERVSGLDSTNRTFRKRNRFAAAAPEHFAFNGYQLIPAKKPYTKEEIAPSFAAPLDDSIHQRCAAAITRHQNKKLSFLNLVVMT